MKLNRKYIDNSAGVCYSSWATYLFCPVFPMQSWEEMERLELLLWEYTSHVDLKKSICPYNGEKQFSNQITFTFQKNKGWFIIQCCSAHTHNFGTAFCILIPIQSNNKEQFVVIFTCTDNLKYLLHQYV